MAEDRQFQQHANTHHFDVLPCSFRFEVGLSFNSFDCFLFVAVLLPVSFLDQRVNSWPTRRESGVFWMSGLTHWSFAKLQCTAGTLLGRRHSEST